MMVASDTFSPLVPGLITCHIDIIIITIIMTWCLHVLVPHCCLVVAKQCAEDGRSMSENAKQKAKLKKLSNCFWVLVLMQDQRH